MIYVLDTNSLSNILNHYYPDRFPTFWNKFYSLIQSRNIISVREVRFELTLKFNDDIISLLTQHNNEFFTNPHVDELSFIGQIYAINHFQQNLDKKKLLQGGYFADPFIIAKAKVTNGTVITEEEKKEHAARIHNICDHFKIQCDNLQGFLTKENWKF